MKDLVVPVLAALLVLVWLGTCRRITAALKVGAPANADALTFMFSTIGALVTGVSIVELGIKDNTGQAPNWGIALSLLSDHVTDIQRIISGILLVAWVAVGIWSLKIWLFDDGKPGGGGGKWDEGLALVQNHAKAWIGFAVAAVFAYLGIKAHT